MSMYLFDEQPIVANKSLARALGLNEALILQQLNYWLEINKKSGNNYYEGRYWTYNSIRAWQEKDFDYMSIDTVKRTFAKLEKEGYLLVGHFNKDPRDKTKWYTINEERLEKLYEEIENKKQQEAQKMLEQNAYQAMPNALGQNAPMEEGKMHQCKSAESTNALEQNLLMQDGRLPQPLPEITTKNSTKITTDISSENSTHPPIRSYPHSNLWEEGKVDSNLNDYESSLSMLREQVGYNEHKSLGNHFIAKDYDEIVKILADVMILRDDEIVTINQMKLPAKVVKERFRQLNSGHMDYLCEALKDNEHKIRNVRAFLLTAAYNAPSNMDAYYTALVNYDMKEGYWRD
ncbi:TPA: conjugal transfer protein [Enterococcus faecalis]|nr:conjugal transfer protein [Enterococcus faecalis]